VTEDQVREIGREAALAAVARTVPDWTFVAQEAAVAKWRELGGEAEADRKSTEALRCPHGWVGSSVPRQFNGEIRWWNGSDFPARDDRLFSVGEYAPCGCLLTAEGAVPR